MNVLERAGRNTQWNKQLLRLNTNGLFSSGFKVEERERKQQMTRAMVGGSSFLSTSVII